jgi:MYXO-CTERM domain-containing protein
LLPTLALALTGITIQESRRAGPRWRHRAAGRGARRENAYLVKATVLPRVFAVCLLAGLGGAFGCGGETGAGSGAADDGARSGQLAVYISDDAAGNSTTSYYLRDARGAEQKLLFDAAPEVEPGAAVKLWGVETPGGLRVLSYERLPTPQARVVSPLISAPPFSPRSFAFVLVDIGGGVNITADAVNGIMGTNVDSIRSYYLGDSYQMQDITTTVFGPVSYTMSACGNDDATALATALRPMVTSAAGGATFQHYLWYLGSRNPACLWSGLASVGTAEAPSRDTWYNAATNCVVLVQEPGHNFGLQHSSSLACTGGPFADDPNTCTASEYGDAFDPMGAGCRHMNAWQKSYQGWFGGCNGVRVTSSGTFNLVPFELSCSGVQFLQIKAVRPRSFQRPAAGGGAATTENLAYYYVELRTPVDFDGTLGLSSRTALTPMVLVHVADDLRARTEQGVHTFLLDMTPSTAGSRGLIDAGLAVGETFTDPAGGLSITTDTLTASGAQITVTYAAGGGRPICLDGNAFAPPGPGVESCSAPPGATGSGGTPATTGTGGASGTGAGGSSAPAGAAGTSGAGSGSGAGGVNGVVPAGDGPPTATGCACAVAADGAPSPLLAAALLLGATVVRRCRRSSRPGSGRGRAPRPGR